MKTMIDLETYLKQPGLMRIWPIIRDKYIQLSRVGGSVTLRRLSDEERDALSGLLVKNFYGKSQVTVNLNVLDASLRATRFEASLEHCLEILYPDTLRTRNDTLHAEEVRWQNFCKWALEQATGAHVEAKLLDWIRSLIHRNGPGYRTFLECYEEFCSDGNRNEHGDLSLSWMLAISALSRLPVRDERLPIFAARITGDAHGLDRDCLVGRMFYYGIRMLFTGAGMKGGVDGGMAADLEAESGGEEGNDTESLRNLYKQAGILLDDVSSLVLVTGWHGISEQPVALPLYTVEQIISSDLFSASPTLIYVVENPSIFTAVMDKCSQGGKVLQHPLVCTSGQPSLAALRLLDFARDGGARIFYSGDFDVKGLQIAYQLKNRYSDNLELWRMDEESYIHGLHPRAPELSEIELAQLAKILQADTSLYAAMLVHRRKVYQEHLVDVILQDYGEGTVAKQ